MARKLILEGNAVSGGVAYEYEFFRIGEQELSDAIIEFLGEPVETGGIEGRGSWHDVFPAVRITVELLDGDG